MKIIWCKTLIIISTNLEFSQWTQLFENEMLLAALIDRVTFRSFVLNMNCSSSYRIDSTLNHDQWLKIFLSQLAHFFISEVAQFFIDKGILMNFQPSESIKNVTMIQKYMTKMIYTAMRNCYNRHNKQNGTFHRRECI